METDICLKANRAGPSLELVRSKLWLPLGRLTGPQRHSLSLSRRIGHSGSPSADGAVYLRDLSDGKVSTVVPPYNKGQYSIPRVYGKEVIYFRDRVLHRVGLDGTAMIRSC